MKKINITFILLLLSVLPAASAEKAILLKIDSGWEKNYQEIYSHGLTHKTAVKFKDNIRLCRNELKKNPNDYELLWRYARAAAQYAEAAQSMRNKYTDWSKICRKYGLDGFQKATKACNMRPDRPEAFFWRNYCIGKYVLIGGIIPFVNAIREGFLPKSEESVIRGYTTDKTYLDYIPVFARFQFLAHLPSVPFFTKGSKEDRFREAMNYFEEHVRMIKGKENKIFEWDIRAPYTSEFILMAIETLQIKGTYRTELLDYAEKMCRIGLKGPRPYYVKWSRKINKDIKKLLPQ